VSASEVAEIGPRGSAALDVVHRDKGIRTVGDEEEVPTSAGGTGVGDVSMEPQGTMIEDVTTTERPQVDQDEVREYL
jgi:hypothetical protein